MLRDNSEFKENLFSSSNSPTAPPRTLPLKTQWPQDRQSNGDNIQIHCRTPSQETAKRKQAVNHLPPNLFVSHRKVKHCMSFRRCRANLVFNHLKTKQNKKKSHTFFRTHVAVYEKVQVPSHRIIDRPSSRPWPRELFVFPCSLSAKLDICLALSEPRRPLSKVPIA